MNTFCKKITIKLQPQDNTNGPVNIYCTNNIETDDKGIDSSNQILDQRCIRFKYLVLKKDEYNINTENYTTSTAQEIIIVLPKKDNDLYNTDSKKILKKSTHNDYVNDTLSSNSEFDLQYILLQPKNTKTISTIENILLNQAQVTQVEKLLLQY